MKKLLACSTLFLCVFKCLYADSTLVSGTVINQTWTIDRSPYYVNGNINVAGLTIKPGVEIIFLGDYYFEVSGIITAIGEAEKPIVFTQDSTETGWGGILFQNTVPGSKMHWCTVEHAKNSGIRIIESSPELSYCTIRNNSTTNSGGGLKIFRTSTDDLDIYGCIIESNRNFTSYKDPSSNGGGVYVSSDNGKVRFINCIVADNIADRSDGHVSGGGVWAFGNIDFIGCIIEGNEVFGHDDIPGGTSSGNGGGVYVEQGTTNFFNTIVRNNSARGYAIGGFSGNSGYAFGGGVHVNEGNINFVNSICSHNTVSGSHGRNGGGVYTNTGLIHFENSTLAYNNLHAIENITADVNIINSIIYFNNEGNEQIMGNFTATFSDVQGSTEGEGNINFNPVFFNDSTLIIVEGSPCIDSGNPDTLYNDVSFPPSLGGVRNDIGAHGGPGAIGWPDFTTDTTDTPVTNLDVTVCDSFLSPSGLYTYTSSGTYNDTLQNINGYDSVLVINLTVLRSTSSTIEESTCNSYMSPSGNYTWTSSNTYTDTIPNTAGCDSIITINLTKISIDSTVSQNETTLYVTEEGGEYQWLDCNNNFISIFGETSQSFSPETSGSYAVKITKNSCSDTTFCYEYVVTGIIENDFEDLLLYPNPSNDYLTIKLGDTYDDTSVTITDVMGKIVLKKSFIKTNLLHLEFQVPKGLYLVNVQTKKRKMSVTKVLRE